MCINNSGFGLLFVAITLLFISCTTNKDNLELLDYSTIPLIELQNKFSIKESEEYIPGQINDLMVSDDGYILVSQRAEKSIHQFDSLGNHITRVAGPGRGPGELSRNANPHFTGERLVMSNNNGMFTEYRQNNEGVFEYYTDHLFRLPVQGNMIGIRSEDDLSEFYVNVDSVDYPFLTLPPEFTTDYIHLIRRDGDSMFVQEKILSLKRHSPYIEITNGGNSMRYTSLPYRYSDFFTALPQGKLLVSRPDKSIIQIYNKNFQIEYVLDLNVKDRPVTDSELEFHFPDKSTFEISKRKKMIMELKPPFMKVLLDEKNRFWLYTDNTEKGKEYVILSYEGEPLGRVLLPSTTILHAIQDGKIYLVHHQGESFIDVYEFNMSSE